MKPKVEVRCGNGEVHSYDIESSEITVGSSTSATISLDRPTELDPKHILLVPRGRTGCWVSVAEGARTPVKIGNDDLTNGLVPWGSDLRIGSISVCLRAGDTRANLPSLWRAGVLILVLATLAVAAARFVHDDGLTTIEEGLTREHPDLFGHSTSCPRDDDAMGDGARAERAARSRAERYPYDPRDGVRGVQSYRMAASCYEAAGRPDHAERTSVAAVKLAHRLDADYAAARLSLAHAIESERWTDVLRETRRLELLTSHLGEHEYVEWLEEVAGKATARHRSTK